MATTKKATSPAREESKALAVVSEETKALAMAVPNYADDAGFGLEGVQSEDYAIPRLKVAQDLTPATKSRDAAYIPGLEVGMVFDPVSGRFWDTANKNPVRLVLVHYAKNYAEFVPRKKGGGFVANYGSDSTVFNTASFMKGEGFMLRNGNEIVPSMDFYAFIVNDDGTHEQCLVSFAKTDTTEGKRLVTLASTLKIEVPDQAQPGKTKRITPALFYRSYLFSTVLHRKDQNAWFGYKVTPDKATIELPSGDLVYQDAREWRGLIVAGKVKVQAPSTDDAPSAAATDESAPM
jgi:hypothetical protein